MPPVRLCSHIAPRSTSCRPDQVAPPLPNTATSCGVHDTSHAAVYCRKSCPMTQWDLQEQQPCSCPVASWQSQCCPESSGHGSTAQFHHHLLDLWCGSRGGQWRSKGHSDRVWQLLGPFPEETTA